MGINTEQPSEKVLSERDLVDTLVNAAMEYYFWREGFTPPAFALERLLDQRPSFSELLVMAVNELITDEQRNYWKDRADEARKRMRDTTL